MDTVSCGHSAPWFLVYSKLGLSGITGIPTEDLREKFYWSLNRLAQLCQAD
jgi:hypothetical protein